MEKMVMEITQDFEYMEMRNDKQPQNSSIKPHLHLPQSKKQEPLLIKIQFNYELIEEYLG
ncbi:hypothetical protein [Bacillus sp. AK128]